MIKILHNNNCSKSRGVLEYLDEHGIAFEVIDIVNQPLTELEIRTVLKKMNANVRDIIRTEDKFFQENFTDKNFSDEEWITILHKNPSLIQRPILIKGPVAMLGRPLENVKLFLEH